MARRRTKTQQRFKPASKPAGAPRKIIKRKGPSKEKGGQKKKKDVMDVTWLATDLGYGGIDYPRRDSIPGEVDKERIKRNRLYLCQKEKLEEELKKKQKRKKR